MTLLGMLSFAACANPEEDYKAGLASYRVNDIVGAMTPLKSAADAGHAAAQALYGEILDRAELDADAAEYLRKAAAQDNPDGMYGIAKMYLTGEAEAPDEFAPGKLMRGAAESGHRSAILAMSSAFIRGDERLGAKDQTTEEARKYLTLAAELGETGAMGALADGYRTGKYGFQIDAGKAKEWESNLAKAISGLTQGNKK